MCPAAGKPADSESIRRTPLYDLHLEHGGKMVPFAGYSMPLHYEQGIRHEHDHTRAHAGLFDVSHMGQIRLLGTGMDAALEELVCSDITALTVNQVRYTLLTNDSGGVVDDLMVTRRPDGLHLVVNAACKHTDLGLLRAVLDERGKAEMLSESALLALQGPAAASVLHELNPAVIDLDFMQAGDFDIDGTTCFVTRSGYTGEDGFEIAVAAGRARSLAELLLDQADVEPAGLGARDTLRLEAGLCLYGHELDETTTPVEADLAWVIASKYRSGAAPARFPGSERILEQLRTGAARKRVGLKPDGRLPVREGTPLLNGEGLTVGLVTSGGFGPTLGGPVAMGYVNQGYTDPGTELTVTIRNRSHPVHVVALPFVPHRYHKP